MRIQSPPKSASCANNRPLRLDQKSFPKQTLKDKCPRTVYGYLRGSNLRKSLGDYSIENLFYTKRLQFHRYTTIDRIDEVASRNTRYMLRKSKKGY